MISHATNVVESTSRMSRANCKDRSVVGRENVIACTDCGFAQGPFYRRVHPSIMWENSKPWSGGSACQPGALALMPVG